MIGKKSDSGTTRSMSRHILECNEYRQKGKQSMLNAYISRDEDQSKLRFNTRETNLDKVLKFFVSGNIAFNQADNL